MRDFAKILAKRGRIDKAIVIALVLKWELELRRRPRVRNAAAARTMTPAKHNEVVRLLSALPDADYQEIATLAGVNTGRVSEIAAGKRT
jgi:hypothetical protein